MLSSRAAAFSVDSLLNGSITSPSSTLIPYLSTNPEETFMEVDMTIPKLEENYNQLPLDLRKRDVNKEDTSREWTVNRNEVADKSEEIFSQNFTLLDYQRNSTVEPTTTVQPSKRKSKKHNKDLISMKNINSIPHQDIPQPLDLRSYKSTKPKTRNNPSVSSVHNDRFQKCHESDRNHVFIPNYDSSDLLNLMAPAPSWLWHSSQVFPKETHKPKIESRLDENVHIELQQRDLWNEFHRMGTEMIITKVGRRMFPLLRFRINGLHPEKMYAVYLEMKSIDLNRYRYIYASSQWSIAGPGESPLSRSSIYVHPDSPSTGEYWNTRPNISFEKLKLTNSKEGYKKGQICLHSMQKYQPRLWIQELPSFTHTHAQSMSSPSLTPLLEDPIRLPKLQETSLENTFSADNPEKNKSLVAVFEETRFITVTAYQNQQITKLKINSNPFAKGFRDVALQRDFFPNQFTNSHK